MESLYLLIPISVLLVFVIYFARLVNMLHRLYLLMRLTLLVKNDLLVLVVDMMRENKL